MLQSEIEAKLQKLREQWIKASLSDRKLIEIRAKILKMGLDPETPTTYEDVKAIFLGNQQTGLSY